MRTASEVSAAKLRGGFYTPAALVDLCVARVLELADGRGSLRVLEPSAGDGAFLRGLAGCGGVVASVTAIEPMEIEAAKARHALAAAGLAGEVRVESAIGWAACTDDRYDAAVGNPPFVRYQFVSAVDRAAALALAQRVGVRLAGVANLWIPVLLGALSRLRAGGVFAFVVPAECLTGCSAGAVRRWLVDEAEAVRFDVFAPGSFPGVLQEVAVLSGRRRAAAARGEPLCVRIGMATHRVSDDGPWTRLLLSPAGVAALEAAVRGPAVQRLGSIAAFEVSIVTGANDFFTVPSEVVERHGLGAWARPLLPRARHAPGLVYGADDHEATLRDGARGWLLDFAADAPDPLSCAGAADYLRAGEGRGLHERYKCRIRTPWYRVPGIRSGALMLSKRSHLHPRVIVNEAGVFTTDTIYRGRVLERGVSSHAIAARFHNSLTLLSAELEGRSFGGGVLELVPSEIARLLTFAPQGDDRALLARLDTLARAGDGAAVIAETDADLIRRGLVDADVMAELAAARQSLLERRLARNRRAGAGRGEARTAA